MRENSGFCHLCKRQFPPCWPGNTRQGFLDSLQKASPDADCAPKTPPNRLQHHFAASLCRNRHTALIISSNLGEFDTTVTEQPSFSWIPTAGAAQRWTWRARFGIMGGDGQSSSSSTHFARAPGSPNHRCFRRCVVVSSLLPRRVSVRRRAHNGTPAGFAGFARSDGRNHAALAAFEQILREDRKVRCDRVDLKTAQTKGLADADCAVVFGRGLQIVSDWSSIETDVVAGTVPIFVSAKMGLSLAPPHDADRGTVPIFVSAKMGLSLQRRLTMPTSCLPRSKWPLRPAGIRCSTGSVRFFPAATCPPLPIGQSMQRICSIRRCADGVAPAAWARDGDKRAFCTLLGHAEDFRRPEFVRLLLNAIEWVGR